MLFCDPQGRISSTAPQVSLLDHGFLFGDSLYEVVRLYNGRIFGWDEHIDRLKVGGQRTGINFESKLPFVEEYVPKLFQEFGQPNACCRIIITRGVGQLHINPSTCNEPNVYMACWGFDRSQRPENLRVMIPKIRRNHKNTMDPGIKSGNYLNNVLAFKEAIEAGFDDALMLNPMEEVTELTTSNVGWIKDGVIKTPHFDCGILYGITRHFFLKTQAVEDGKYSIQDLREADEVFALSTLKEITPITEIQFSPGDSKDYPLGEKSRKLLEDFESFVEESISNKEKIL